MTGDKLGGQIALEGDIHQKFKQRRHRYPCTVCMVFNMPACEQCKCDKCDVPEDKCVKCKNIPKTLSQYQVLHGITQPGENWNATDLLTCQRCGQSWNVGWDKLPGYLQCASCHTVYFAYPYFIGGYKGCLKGARRPGMNWEKQDVFKCPACHQLFYVEQRLLPSNQRCSCGRVYYCYRSPEPQRQQGTGIMKDVENIFK